MNEYPRTELKVRLLLVEPNLVRPYDAVENNAGAWHGVQLSVGRSS